MLHILMKKEVIFVGRLVIDGEQVYELDEECLREKYREEAKKRKYGHSQATDTVAETNRGTTK